MNKKIVVFLLSILYSSSMYAQTDSWWQHIWNNITRYIQSWFSPTSEKTQSENVYKIGNIKLHITKQDMLTLPVEAVVNAANKQLPWPCGGVCNVIYTAAGAQKLNEYVQQNLAPQLPLEVGQAVITPSFNLTQLGIKYIIHAVGPDCRISEDVSKIKDAYSNSIALAQQYKINSLVFPAISVGIFACDKKQCVHYAIEAIRDAAREIGSVKDIFISVYNPTVPEKYDKEYYDYCVQTVKK